MKPWVARSPEEANLFNPAFLSLVSYHCIKGYTVESSGASPYVLPFLCCPLVLHKSTRESLPKSVATSFACWINRFEVSMVKVNFDKRARSMVPVVKEALAYALANQLLTVDAEGSFVTDVKPISEFKGNVTLSEEVRQCFNNAHFCGRWLARAGKIETVMSLLGVKP